MAISKGNQSVETQDFKRYIGVCPVFIKAVNPNKKEHEELFNTELEEAPNYVGTVSDSEGNEYANARISVVMMPDSEKIGFEMPLVTMALFIQNRPRVGSVSGKYQVIDKYGRTAWATAEDIKEKRIPVYSNGPADIDIDYRPAFVGEEDLINFVKSYLCIPNVTVWDNNLKKMVPNTKVKPEECECRFDNLPNIFKGDFSEIQDALGFQPTNKVKVLLGVRTDAESGKLYQSVYTKRFLRNSSNNYSSLDKEIQDMINTAATSGRVINTEYQVVPVHEYSVTPTNIVTVADTTNSSPFDTAQTDNLPWE